MKVLESIATRGGNDCVVVALSRATQGAKRRQCESIESWHAATHEIAAHFSGGHLGPMQAAQRAGARARILSQLDQLRARVVSGWHYKQANTNCKGKIAARGDHSVDALPRIQKEQNLLSFVSIRSLSTVLQHSCSPRACDLRAVWRGETRMGARIAGRTHSNHAFTSAAAPRGRAHAVAARTRPTQTTQIIASSASRCRAFANRVALRRQK